MIPTASLVEGSLLPPRTMVKTRLVLRIGTSPGLGIGTWLGLPRKLRREIRLGLGLGLRLGYGKAKAAVGLLLSQPARKALVNGRPTHSQPRTIGLLVQVDYIGRWQLPVPLPASRVDNGMLLARWQHLLRDRAPPPAILLHLTITAQSPYEALQGVRLGS